MQHEIRIYDAIGGGGITAESLAAGIPEGTSEITVRLNSPGGAVSDGLAIYNYLRDHGAKVTTIVDGYAASAASIVMLAGDVRLVHESSVVVIHNPWTIAAGDSRDMRHNAVVLDELRTALLDIYKDRTGMDIDELAAMVDAETWMRGAVAVEYGFADEVIRYEEEEYKQAASVHFGRMLEIINGGNELMSKQLTRKEIEEQAAMKDTQLADALAQIEVVKDELGQAQAALVAEHEAALASIAIERDEAQAKIVDIEAKLTEATAALEAEKVARAEVEAVKVEIEAEKIAAVAEADKAKAALVNPAVADAALNNPNGLPNAVLDAEADAQEEIAQAEAEAKEPQNVAEQWEAMEASQQRVDFWNKNKREILSIIGARK